jgi:hypothetical protein
MVGIQYMQIAIDTLPWGMDWTLENSLGEE